MYNILGILVLIIWATSAPLLKQIIISSNNNFFMVVISYNILASIISLIISYFKKEHLDLKKINNNKKLLSIILLNGFYDVFVAIAIALSTIVQYAIIANYIWPIILLILISVKLKERISIKTLSSTIIGFISILIIILPDTSSFEINNFFGIICGIIAATFWATYSVLLEDQHKKISFLIQGLAQAVSGIVILVITLALGQFNFKDISFIGSYSLIIIYSILNMTFAYVLWITVIVKHPNIAKFTGTIYILPILSLIFSTIWFGDSFTYKLLIAGPVLIIGLFISQTNPNKLDLRRK